MNLAKMGKKPPNGLKRGRIIADHGRHIVVEDEFGEAHACTIRNRHIRAVCGDWVHWQANAHGGRGVVETRLARSSELIRPDHIGRADVLAANHTQLIVVCALKPALDADLIDRYLVAAALMKVSAIIVCNKMELAAELSNDHYRQRLDEYRAIPYPVVETSVKTGAGLEELAKLADGHTSILVGQSGVGKSSLLNVLRPQTDVPVGELSASSGEGTHTTRASKLFRLPAGGELIDAPGVREYTPHLEADQNPAFGFIEFDEPSENCKFRNCQHLNEPNCGVKNAVAAGQISQRRYNSYCALLTAE